MPVTLGAWAVLCCLVGWQDVQGQQPRSSPRAGSVPLGRRADTGLRVPWAPTPGFQVAGAHDRPC